MMKDAGAKGEEEVWNICPATLRPSITARSAIVEYSPAVHSLGCEQPVNNRIWMGNKIAEPGRFSHPKSQISLGFLLDWSESHWR